MTDEATGTLPTAVTKAYDVLLWLIAHVGKFPRSHWFVLTRIIHERFCCNREFAAATSLRRAGSPLAISTYWFKYASVPRGSACPSRHATTRFGHEPS